MGIFSIFSFFVTSVFVIILVVLFLLWCFKGIFGVFFENLGKSIYEFYKYFTFIRPNLKNGKIQKQEQEQINKQVMKQAQEDRKRHKRNIKRATTISQAVVNRANYLQTKFPLVSEDLIDLFVESFETSTLEEISEIEATIEKNHVENAKNSLSKQGKVYTIDDITNRAAVDMVDQMNFRLKLYLIDDSYILYIRDNTDNSETLIQTKSYNEIAPFMLDIGKKNERLMYKYDSINRLGG